MATRSTWRTRDPSVRQCAWNLSLVILGLTVVGICSGPRIVSEFFDRTRSIGWHTPEGSASIGAAARVSELFPSRSRGAIVIAVEALPGTETILSEPVAQFSRNISASVSDDPGVQRFKPVVVGYYLPFPGGKLVESLVRQELVSSDKRVTLLLIQPTQMGGDIGHANSLLQEFCQKAPEGYTVHITGLASVLSGNGCFAGRQESVNTRDMSFEGILKAEVCTIPIAILVIGRMVGYFRLLLLPLMTVASTFVLAAAMMTPWMEAIPIPKDVPAAMFSLTLALSLDYSLFFLSRFSEQHSDGWTLQNNVDTVLKQTGHTILVSGTLVAIALFGSMVLPEECLKGTGFSMGITVLCAVMVSATIIPAMLLVAGGYLTGSVFKATRLDDVELDVYNARQVFEVTFPSRKEISEHRMKIMCMVDRAPLTSIVVVLLLMSPAILAAPALNITGDRFALLPMGMPALQAMRQIQKSFPLGALDPITVTIWAPPATPKDLLKEPLIAARSLINAQKNQSASLLPRRLNAVDTGFVEGATAQTSNGPFDWFSSPQPARSDRMWKKVGCAGLAAVGAGAGAASAVGGTESAVQAAFRAGSAGGCSANVTGRAVAAALETVRPGSTKRVTNDASNEPRAQLFELVRQEARASGYDENEAVAAAEAFDRGLTSPYADPRVARAVKAGALAVQSEVPETTGSQTKSLVHERALLVDDIATILKAIVSATKDDLDALSKVDLEKSNSLVVSVVTRALASLLKSSEDAPALAASNPQESDVADGQNDIKMALVLQAVSVASDLFEAGNKTKLLLPSGYSAMLDFCDTVLRIGKVSAMVGPSWAYRHRLDWPTAVALGADASTNSVFQGLLDSHVNGGAALFEIHTMFLSIGAGGSSWIASLRQKIVEWENAYPGFTAEVSGGASEAADTRQAVLYGMWKYLGLIVPLIMLVVLATFRSVMVAIRFALALIFTLAATYGTGVLIYQTPLLHAVCPWLVPFDGITFEVVPMVTGVCIALGLDYDIYLVCRIVELRKDGFTDRASVIRGSAKAGSVISAAGVIMALAFSGLCFSDKLLMQQFGVLLVVSVLLDTFVVRTMLVPALMLVAKDWNWWPRRMPSGFDDSVEDASGTISEDDLYQPFLNTE